MAILDQLVGTMAMATGCQTNYQQPSCVACLCHLDHRPHTYQQHAPARPPHPPSQPAIQQYIALWLTQLRRTCVAH